MTLVALGLSVRPPLRRTTSWCDAQTSTEKTLTTLAVYVYPLLNFVLYILLKLEIKGTQTPPVCVCCKFRIWPFVPLT